MIKRLSLTLLRARQLRGEEVDDYHAEQEHDGCKSATMIYLALATGEQALLGLGVPMTVASRSTWSIGSRRQNRRDMHPPGAKCIL